MPLNTVAMSTYIKQHKVRRSWWNRLLLRKASSQQWALLLRCDQLLLSNFIRCIDGDLSALIIKGNPPQAEIAEAWANIYSEYIDLNAGNEPEYVLLLQRDVTLLHSHISETESAIYILSILPYFKQEAADILSANGYVYPWDKEDVNNNIQFYEIVNNRLSARRLQYDNKTKELRNIIEGRNENSTTPEYFDIILDNLAAWRKISVIHPDEITVKQFVIMLRSYIRFIDSRKEKEADNG